MLTMTPGGRSLVDEKGNPIVLVADTAWALPFRATHEEVRLYAADRQAKGFNAALLMVVQPDRYAEGPEDRTAKDGFGRAFHDLHLGTLKDRNEGYFVHLDRSLEILREHGIIPILNPLFFGFGWKGKSVIGPVADPAEAADFARFLAARYDRHDALWLVGADGSGREPAVEAMGKAIRESSRQPIGLHYSPWENNAHWEADWCDFHWCQSGHGGLHRPEMVAEMSARTPVRGVANGEPTYEGMGGGRYGLGEWQSREAWLNFISGGTMGVFYGAASLWQWKREGEDDAWDDWCAGSFDWRTALDLPGSAFPGAVRKVLDGLPSADLKPNLKVTRGQRSVANEKMCVAYLEEGGGVNVHLPTLGIEGGIARIHDAKTGELLDERRVRDEGQFMGTWIAAPGDRPIAITVH